MTSGMASLLEGEESFLFCKRENGKLVFIRNEQAFCNLLTPEERRGFTERDFYEEVTFYTDQDLMDYLQQKYPYADSSRIPAQA